MGDPKFARSKTQTPTHPWKQARIDEEHALKEKYGLKKTGGMKEIWREKTSLRRYRNQAMKLIGRVDTSEGHFAREKDQLINSINKKQTVVEVEFEIGGQKFKVLRAIKPGKFEIWQNGRQINQASNARDHQKFLEQNILKLNHKSFHQIVVLGSSSFIPFMQLPAWSRREVIEDLLDINVFSKMNQILKERKYLRYKRCQRILV